MGSRNERLQVFHSYCCCFFGAATFGLIAVKLSPTTSCNGYVLFMMQGFKKIFNFKVAWAQR